MSPAVRPIPEFIWLLLLAVWTLFMALVGRQAFVSNAEAVLGMAETAADSHFADENAYRQWVLQHSGIYVATSARTPPNPYLPEIAERDLVTPSGRQLTLVDAAYLNRQIGELTHKGSVHTRLTSLAPLRPENAPNAWERRGLEQLQNGSVRNKARFTEENDSGEGFLRVIYPLWTTEACLDCHDRETFPPGSLRGGFSIEVPLASYQQAQAGTLAYILFFCVLAWAAGLWLIELFRRYVEAKLNYETKVRRSVAASEKRFRILFDEAGHGSAVVDPNDGTILAGNRALAEMLGQEPQSLVGRPLADLLKESLDLQGQLPGAVDSSSLHLLNADGSVRDVECHMAQIDLDGQAVLYCAFYDNTLRNLYLAETMRTSQMASLGELSAGVAHEINNPVSGVINYAQILLNRGERGAVEEGRELLQRIVKEGERIASIVRSLLAFSRADGDRRERVTVGEIFSEALALIGGRLDKEGITVSIEIAPGLPPVYGNPQQLEQLVLNLIDNARDSLNAKFTDRQTADKQLHLTASVVKGKVHLSVYDNGCGVSEALREKIFTPFFSTKSTEKGTGLGLSICTEIVRRHGGRIELDSRSGDYSRFSVVLSPA